MKVVIDYETRSPVDIRKCGAFVYAEHPATEPMCLAIAIDDESPLLWIPKKFEVPGPLKWGRIALDSIFKLIEEADEITAQNSMFEYLIWNVTCRRLGWPKLPLEKLHDTMAQLAYHALPLNLAQAGAALNLPIQKDGQGHAVMLKLCKVRKPLKKEREEFAAQGIYEMEDGRWGSRTVEPFYLWHQDEADLVKLFNYAGTDVATERLIHNTLPDLPPFERDIWLLDQRINLRGVPIDVETVESIAELTGKREAMLLDRFQTITKGRVSGPRSYVALKNWANGRMDGPNIESVDKNATKDLLDADSTPPEVKAALKVKAEVGKSSVAKFKAILNRVNKDGRLRGAFLYGAASTLRWGGRGLQPQNLPRDSYGPEQYEDIAALFRAGDEEMISVLYDDLFFAASRCVRGSICATPGKELVCSDFSSVEARGLAWLADDFAALKVFKDKLDPYKVAAQGVFNVRYEDVTGKQRQIGKVSELALGYGGGIGAYASMAGGYNIDLETLPEFVMPYATDDELEGDYGAYELANAYLKRNPDSMSFEAAVACDIIKRKWRANRQPTVQFWKDLQKAAYLAVDSPGKVYRVGKLRFCKSGEFLKCMLPSGRIMHYYKPSVRPMKTAFDEAKLTLTYMGMKVVDGKTTRQWVRLGTYGGKLAENCTQAFCRDLLAAGMVRLDAAGYPIVLHVHDEAAAERDIGTSDLDEFNRILSIVPDWAAGMPIAADGWVGKRYRKG